MYFGHINKVISNRYPKAIVKAIEYLQNTNFDELPVGKYEIQGDEIYAQVMELTTKAKEEISPEVHQKHIDVQYLHKGAEIIGVAPDLGTNSKEVDYNPENDMQFYTSFEGEQLITMQPGNFAVFFPEDVHRPGIKFAEPLQIKKVIVKIKVTAL